MTEQDPKWEDSYQKRERLYKEYQAVMERARSLVASWHHDTDLSRKDDDVILGYQTQSYDLALSEWKLSDREFEMYGIIGQLYTKLEEQERSEHRDQKVIDSLKEELESTQKNLVAVHEEYVALKDKNNVLREELHQKINQERENADGRMHDIKGTEGVLDDLKQQSDSLLMQLQELEDQE